MSEDNDKNNNFDLKYLRSLYGGLQGSFDSQAKSLASLDKTVGKMSVVLENIEKKNEDQDNRLNEYSKRIHAVEMTQAGCDADGKIKGHDRELKRLNSFMDLFKRGNGDIDTGFIDTHAQKMMSGNDGVIAPVLFKDAAIKMLPWFLIGAIFCIVVTTLIMAQTVTGKQMVIPESPSIELKTNLSSKVEEDNTDEQKGSKDEKVD